MSFARIVLPALLLAVLHLSAAETNLLESLRNARARRPATAWGEARVGTGTRAEQNPRIQAIGQRLKEALPAPAAAQTMAPRDQEGALRMFQQKAGPGAEVRLRPGNRTVMQLKGKLPEGGKVLRAMAAPEADTKAREFLQENRALLRIDDPARELILENQERDATGERHLRYSQVYNGIPVWPAGLAVHLDSEGTAALVDGAYVPSPAGVRMTPVITAAEAIQRAKQSVADGANGTATEPMLIIYAPLDRAPRLAWKFDFSRDLLSSWRMVVDAENGAILSGVTLVCAVNVSGSAADLGGATRTLNVWSAGGKFHLADTSRPMFNNAFDPVAGPKGVISIFDARNVVLKDLQTVFLIESTSANEWLADGVSALFNFGLTYEYFLERFNRNSLDGNGGNIQAVVRVAEMDNAFWNGSLNMMFFGSVRPYPLALDVVGHELAHGVTQHSADLVYEVQSGALNESFSDIFGEMVELRAEGVTTWKLGERLGKVFRDFKTPGSLQIGGLNRPYPSKMSEYLDLPNNDDNDNGGVHLNSSIINHCFYQLAEGLPGAIGMRDAERIFYRCLSTHLQRQSQFIDARLGCIAAAETLFGAGSTQARKTAEAFDAVGIFATPPTPEPTPIPVVTGDDATLLITQDFLTGNLLLGRRENGLGDPAEGILLADSIKLARPSVSGDGTVAIYVSGTEDLCVMPTDDPFQVQCLGLDGLIHSAAISPDGRFAAFVLNDPNTGQVDNRISVYELATDETRTYDLLAPVLDGSPVDNVLYADALIFSSDSKQLIYDAASQIHFGGGTAVTRWSIFSINLATDSTSVLVPPLELADFGNPNVGRAGSRYLTFDARENSTGTGLIINLDLFTGELGQVGTVGDGWGSPCFTGDESALVYAQRDPAAFATGYSLVKQPLAGTRLAAEGPAEMWYSDGQIGVIYRRGDFVGSNQTPVVAVTSPTPNASFPAGATISIDANASDPDGSIAVVEFYNGSEKLGEDNSAPYTFLWNEAPAGTHRLTARAKDNLGSAADSAVVQIVVAGSEPVPARLGVNLNAGRIQLRLEGSAGNYAIEQSADLRTWTERFDVLINPDGLGTAEDTIDSSPRYYRSRRK